MLLIFNLNKYLVDTNAFGISLLSPPNILKPDEFEGFRFVVLEKIVLY